MSQTGKQKQPSEHFFEVTDHDLRERLSKHLPEAIRETYRVASVTWCLYTKKWLIKVVRKADVQQAATQAKGM